MMNQGALLFLCHPDKHCLIQQWFIEKADFHHYNGDSYVRYQR